MNFQKAGPISGPAFFIFALALGGTAFPLLAQDVSTNSNTRRARQLRALQFKSHQNTQVSPRQTIPEIPTVPRRPHATGSRAPLSDAKISARLQTQRHTARNTPSAAPSAAHANTRVPHRAPQWRHRLRSRASSLLHRFPNHSREKAPAVLFQLSNSDF